MELVSRQSDGRFLKGISASPSTQFKKGGHWRGKRPFWEKDWLIEEYVNKGRSAKDIADDFSVKDAAIYYFLNKHAIPRRSISEAREIKHWGQTGDKNPMFGKTGALNPRYVDGSSPERQSIYSRAYWKSIMKEVFARDKYSCARCKAGHEYKIPLHAHHIKSWAGNPSLRFVLDNVVTLCKGCHHFVHSKKNINNEFL